LLVVRTLLGKASTKLGLCPACSAAEENRRSYLDDELRQGKPREECRQTSYFASTLPLMHRATEVSHCGVPCNLRVGKFKESPHKSIICVVDTGRDRKHSSLAYPSV